MTISSLWRRKEDMATDDDGIYTDEQRKLTLTTVAGDNTAGIHVENNMWLNIDFNSTAFLYLVIRNGDFGFSILQQYRRT
jgi:hypothetical protein